MKKVMIVLLTILLSCAILTGCDSSSDKEQGQTLAVYSFSGENEYFAITNGVIVLTSSEEVFYGGNLEVNQKKFDDIATYSVTYYTMSNNDKNIIITNSIEDMTGNAIHISEEIGQRTGDGTILRGPKDEFKNNLYFEIETTNLDGEKNNYQLQLNLTEITEQATN